MDDLDFDIDVVYPASVTKSENYSSEPPLGPIALVSGLPEKWRRRVRFLDSTILSQEEIEGALRRRRPGLVAISCTTFNYRNALRVGELARELGAFVVVGGIHVTHRFEQVLRAMREGRAAFDTAVRGAGEEPFRELVRFMAGDGDLHLVPSIGYIEEGEIRRSERRSSRFGPDPLRNGLDFRSVRWEEYWLKYRGIGVLSEVQRPSSMYTQRGCAYSGGRKCEFCSIEEINPRRSRQLVQEDIRNLLVDFAVDHIRLSDGDFTTNRRHMAAVAEAAEGAFAETGQKASFYCFSRADEIDHDRIELLRRLNLNSTFIGYESGSNRMLSSMRKFTTVEQNLTATTDLGRSGIEVTCGGIVLGGEGEDRESLKETLEFVRHLKQIGNTRALVATPLIPLPGSPSFNRLLGCLELEDQGKARELREADDLDIFELTWMWNRYFSDADLASLVNVSKEIEEIAGLAIKFFDGEELVTASAVPVRSLTYAS